MVRPAPVREAELVRAARLRHRIYNRRLVLLLSGETVCSTL